MIVLNPLVYFIILLKLTKGALCKKIASTEINAYFVLSSGEFFISLNFSMTVLKFNSICPVSFSHLFDNSEMILNKRESSLGLF